MNIKTLAVVFAATLVATLAHSQSPSEPSPFVGVWHANVAGQPTGTLTLATDTGELGGTIVLDIISDRSGTPRVIASEPHVLMSPHVSGNTLSFQVKMEKPDGTIVVHGFTVTLTAPRKANIHCATCGDAPVVELTKDR